MAQEYEVREEFRNSSLDQLLASSVLCFQGVGEIQSELIKQYFGIATVQDLANMAQFLGALEIQELAVNGGDLATQPMSQIARSRKLQVQLRERAADMTPRQLMNESVQALDGLTPGQDLALYDIFRITNITHLAQNRIMLESRIIQYLQGQEAAGGEPKEEDGVATVLGRPSSRTAARRVTEGRGVGGGLEAAAQETSEHVQSRLETLRDRAKARAGAIGRGEGLPAAGQRGSIGTRTAGAGKRPESRADAIRTSRAQAGGGRAAPVASSRLPGREPGAPVARGVTDRTMRTASGRPTGRVIDQVTRRGTAGTSVSRERGAIGAGTGRGLARGGTIGSRAEALMAARGLGGTAAATTDRRPTGGGAGRPIPRGAVGGGGTIRTYGGGSTGGSSGGGGSTVRSYGGAGTSGGSSTSRATAAAAVPTTVVAATAAGAAATPSTSAAAVRSQGPGVPPGVILLIVAAIVVIGALWFFMRGTGSGPQTAPGTTASSPGAAAPGGAMTSGGAVAPAGSSSTMTGPQSSTGAGTVRTGATAPAKAGSATQAGSGGQGTATGPVTVHTVQSGQSLWRIARRYFTFGSKWPAIYHSNEDQIENPDLIFPQQKFNIPAKP